MKLSLKYLFFIPFILVGCEAEPEQNIELSEQLLGEWRNVSLKINMNTFNNTDSSKLFEVSEKEWETKMRIRPIRTFYRANGTYNSEHINLKDSLIFNPAGKWIIMGDTLMMRDTFPPLGATYKYKLAITGNIAEFWGLEDCDHDGKDDDNYYGTQRKQK